MTHASLPCLLTLSLLWCSDLWAQTEQPATPAGEEVPANDDKAIALYNAGVAFYESGRYVAAIEAFEEAYRLSGRHLLLLNIASAYEKLGKLGKAVDALERFEPHADPERQVPLKKRIASLHERIKSQRPTPTPSPASSVPPLAPATPPLAPVGDPLDPTSLDQKATLAPRTEGSNAVAWVSVAAGGALMAAGGTLLLLGEADHRDLQDRLEDRSLNVRFPQQRQEAQELDESADQKKLLGVVFLGLGAATAATGALLFVLGSEDEGDEMTLSLVPQPTGGATLYGRF